MLTVALTKWPLCCPSPVRWTAFLWHCVWFLIVQMGTLPQNRGVKGQNRNCCATCLCMWGCWDGPLAFPAALAFFPSILCSVVQNYLSIVEGLAVFQVRLALSPWTISVVKVIQEFDFKGFVELKVPSALDFISSQRKVFWRYMNRISDSIDKSVAVCAAGHRK